MTLARWRWIMIGSAICFYSLFFYGYRAQEQNIPIPLGLTAVIMLALGVFGWSLLHLPLYDWVRVMMVFVPLEISTPLYPFSSFSPLDYICAVGLIGLIYHFGIRSFMRSIQWHFGIWALAFWFLFYTYGWIDTKITGGNFRGILRTGEFLYAYLLARLALEENPRLSHLLAHVLSWIGGIASLIAIGQFIRSSGDYTKAYATFQHHNGFSAFLSLCLPAMWGRIYLEASPRNFARRAWAWIGTVAFILSFSRGAWLGLAIGIVLIHLPKRITEIFSKSSRYAFTLLMSSFLSAAIIPLILIHRHPEFTINAPRNTPHGLTMSQRPIYWKTAFDIIEDHPWRGLGPGNFELRVRDYLSKPERALYENELSNYHRVVFWQHLHSVYLQHLIDLGWLGFVLWTLALCSVLTPAFVPGRFQAWDQYIPYFLISVIAFLVHNTVDIIFVSSLDLLFAFLLAVTCTRSRAPL